MLLESKLSNLYTVRDSGIAPDNIQEKIDHIKKTLNGEKKNLKRKRDSANRSKKARDVKKQKLQELFQSYPEAAASCRIQEKSGQPRIENSQPELLKVNNRFLHFVSHKSLFYNIIFSLGNK